MLLVTIASPRFDRRECGTSGELDRTSERRAFPPSTLNSVPVTAGQRLTTPARALRPLS